MLTAQQLSEKIQIPCDEWHGNCHSIASRALPFIKEFAPDARLVRGVWLGEMHLDSTFFGRLFTGHTWIESGDQVIDPTQWTIADPHNPAIYMGDKLDAYDEGGNRLRGFNRTPRPYWDANSRQLRVDFGDSTDIVNLLLDHYEETYSVDQVFWIANINPHELRRVDAVEIYGAISKAGMAAFIPLDNLNTFGEG